MACQYRTYESCSLPIIHCAYAHYFSCCSLCSDLFSTPVIVSNSVCWGPALWHICCSVGILPLLYATAVNLAVSQLRQSDLCRMVVHVPVCAQFSVVPQRLSFVSSGDCSASVCGADFLTFAFSSLEVKASGLYRFPFVSFLFIQSNPSCLLFIEKHTI